MASPRAAQDPEHTFNELNKKQPHNDPQHPLSDPNHPEHPQPPIVKVMDVLSWKTRCDDIFSKPSH